jgi:DNA-binding MarR family transcriptional regulator
MAKSTAHDASLHAWAVFLSTHATLVERIEAALAAAELPPLAWYDVLWALESVDGGRLRMHELAQRVVLSRSNLTRLADRLEAAGLTSRERCADDRRGAYAVLTAAGREMRKRMWPVYRKQIETLFTDHLGQKEAAMLSDLLTRILLAARQHGD